MLTPDPLFEARAHIRQLHAEAASRRLRPRPSHRLLAEALRGAANWLDPTPVALQLRSTHR
jgi:hypothetical protein